MNRRGDRYDDNFDNENNFDRQFDARAYRDDYSQYDSYDNRDERPFRRRDDNARRDDYRRVPRQDDRYSGQEEHPKKRSFFSRMGGRKNSNDEYSNPNNVIAPNQFIVMTPKSFDDIRGIIDNLKQHNGLIIDLCRLKDNSIQRVLDYINGAVYALDGSIQRINPGVFLLAPSGMAISVPIDYIKDKWERNKRK